MPGTGSSLPGGRLVVAGSENDPAMFGTRSEIDLGGEYFSGGTFDGILEQPTKPDRASEKSAFHRRFFAHAALRASH
jgi:hypothetical protein